MKELEKIFVTMYVGLSGLSDQLPGGVKWSRELLVVSVTW